MGATLDMNDVLAGLGTGGHRTPHALQTGQCDIRSRTASFEFLTVKSVSALVIWRDRATGSSSADRVDSLDRNRLSAARPEIDYGQRFDIRRQGLRPDEELTKQAMIQRTQSVQRES